MKSYEKLNVTLVNNLRKKVEELKQSSERFRAIFEGDRNGILVADAKTMKFISANPAICRMVGYTEKELLQLDISKIHPKKDLPYVIDQFTKQRNGEIDIAESLPILRKDGTIFFCDVNAVPMQINSKAVLAGFFTDITGRKQAEEKIKESNERYSELFEQSKDAILLIDFKGNLFGANKAVKELTGYNGQELLKMKVSDFWPAAENTKLRVLFRKSLEKGGIQTEAHLLTKGRTIKNIEISARVIKLKENSFVQTIIKDVSKQKSAEDRYRVLYESSRDAIMTLEPPKWAFTSGNPATIKMFKAKNEKDFTSRGPWEVSPKYQPDGQLSAAKAKKMIMKAMKEGSNFFEWTHKRINGEDFKATVLLTRAKIGDKTFLQATVRDMTVMR